MLMYFFLKTQTFFYVFVRITAASILKTPTET